MSDSPDTCGLSRIAAIVRDAPSVAEGVRELEAMAVQHIPRSHDVWMLLPKLRWDESVPIVVDALRHRFLGCTPPETNGVYFGLDGLNMPHGKGVEMGCSVAHRAGARDIQFTFECHHSCDDIPLPSLAAYYGWHYHEDDPGHESFGDLDALHVEFPICLGASALVFRDALRAIGPQLLIGSSVERGFAFGFHDGDMMRLGIATAGGFTCDASFEC